MRGILTIGVLSPASYLIYDEPSYPSMKEGSPIASSGIQKGDRILWVDGQLVFSSTELRSVVNEPKALLRVRRGDKEFLTRIPRLQVADLRLAPHEKAELDDWRHEANLKEKVEQLYFIPYNLSYEAVVENPFTYIDETAQESTHQVTARAQSEMPLLSGDKILAVDGVIVTNAAELFSNIQTRRVQIITERKENPPLASWKDEDQSFYAGVNWIDLKGMIQSIGTEQRQTSKGSLYLLKPVIPKPLGELPLTEKQKTYLADKETSQKKQIEEIEDPEKKKEKMRLLETDQKRLNLGITNLQDRLIVYNPAPTTLFIDGFKDTWRTLTALVTGYLNPKWMAGPVGIVEVIHHGWTVGVRKLFSGWL